MFEYFYHEILRKTVISFGTLFNGMVIKHTDSSDNTVSEIKVPLAYGPMQKFLARLEQSADLNKPVQMSLPRMSFEFIGLNYDATRKVTTTQQFITTGQDKKAYMPVPYNMAFELNIMTKLNDDMLQIVEQILPYFQPSYNLSVTLMGDISEKRDIPVILDSVTMNDDYEGDFSTRRALIYTLRFTAKTFLFGPIADASKDLIKKVSVGYLAGATGEGARVVARDVTYSVEPRATKNYDDNIATTISNDISNKVTTILVADASTITENSYIIIDSESMYVDSISNNTLTVKRAQDGTTAASHVAGANVGTITAADNALIESGDDFGFDGSYS
jgi:hypothetical protein|tara:strand:+ start:1392 stop:2387 length:996 start_codon:yes stop_codon:yes gene_type:complete